MITLKEMRDDVRARVNDDEGKLGTAHLTHIINIGQSVVYNQLLPIISIKLTATEKQNTVIGQSEYSLPSNCREVKRVKLNNKKATGKVIEEIDTVDTNTFALATTDEPAYLEWNKKVEIHPTPTSVIIDGIRIDYLKQTIPLLTDMNISIKPEEYHGLIVDYVEGVVLRKLGRAQEAIISENTISKMFTDIQNANNQQLAITELKKEKS